MQRNNEEEILVKYGFWGLILISGPIFLGGLYFMFIIYEPLAFAIFFLLGYLLAFGCANTIFLDEKYFLVINYLRFWDVVNKIEIADIRSFEITVATGSSHSAIGNFKIILKDKKCIRRSFILNEEDLYQRLVDFLRDKNIKVNTFGGIIK